MLSWRWPEAVKEWVVDNAAWPFFERRAVDDIWRGEVGPEDWDKQGRLMLKARVEQRESWPHRG